jgi:hypothetical protein
LRKKERDEVPRVPEFRVEFPTFPCTPRAGNYSIIFHRYFSPPPKILLSPLTNVNLKLILYGKPMVLEANYFILFFQIFHRGGGTPNRC